MITLRTTGIDQNESLQRDLMRASIQSIDQLIVADKIQKVEGLPNLRSISISREGSLYIGGSQGKVACSKDRGASWRVFSPSGTEEPDFRAVSAVSFNVICAMAAGKSDQGLARVYRTVDGGETWKEVFRPEEKGIFFNAMHFFDENNGIILADPESGRFALFSTQDGGEHWSKLVPETMPFAFEGEAAFAASNSCLAVHGDSHAWFCTGGGALARVFYTKDRGVNWEVSATTLAPSQQSAGLFSLFFKNEEEGIAVGGDFRNAENFPSTTLFTTQDGGKNWQPLPCEELQGHYLSAVAMGERGSIYVVDGSKGQFNALAIDDDQAFSVGTSGNFATVSLLR